MVKTIVVDGGVYAELTLLKLKLGARSYNEVIKYLLKTVKECGSVTPKYEVVTESGTR
jgi:predicted CopG family antitoxin